MSQSLILPRDWPGWFLAHQPKALEQGQDWVVVEWTGEASPELQCPATTISKPYCRKPLPYQASETRALCYLPSGSSRPGAAAQQL